ncbi:glycosyltransferase family 4 protein [Agriterribacter sp.]|uniref:glycosyltransferase family 4 protein n=1 Tax=Agriterribacter sp. TaxID=2821509 RepID=UPI002B829F8A|nr:glycosyltransferase family 4 protein [Agriterribacter sp.]HRO47712.1 glycosyltransferase family 4 protein [Agriterribacter sp.]HRQ18073.1 glycosyltransferase family 4 protein [Agriterribacter sp.]
MNKSSFSKPHTIWYISKYANAPLFGAPTRQFFFAKYMAKKGRKVTLVSSRAAKSSNYGQSPDIGLKNQYYYKCEGVQGVMLNGADIKYGFSIKRILSWFIFEIRLLYWSFFKAKEKPDVVIVSSLSILTFLSGIVLKRKFKCKLVVEVRDIWPLTIVEVKKWNRKNIFIQLLSYIEKKGYRNANTIIGSMPNLKEHVKQISPSDADKVHCVPMGYDPDTDVAINAKDPYEPFFSQIRNNNFIVGYAGTIGLVNCVDQIIDAARILKDKPIAFAILGGGPLKEQLMAEAKEDNLNKVYFFDKTNKEMVGTFLKHADLLVNPWLGGNSIYRYGVSPNKWIDYMQSSKPILVALDGYYSVINEAGCGTFIQADHPELMAEEILRFSKMNKTELKQMGEKGKAYLLNNLTYDVLTKKYLNIIDDLYSSNGFTKE